MAIIGGVYSILNQKSLFLWFLQSWKIKKFDNNGWQKKVQKILNIIEKMTMTDNETTLVKVKFSIKAGKNLSQKKIVNLSETVYDLFHFFQSFSNFLKVMIL